MGRTPGLVWPSFDAPLLQEIVAGFRRRQKAIRYSTKMTCAREFTEGPTGTAERLTLDLRGGHFRLSIWADSVMCLSLCSPAPGRNRGWNFKAQFNGDIQDVSAPALVDTTERTLSLPLGSDAAAEREALLQLWSRVRPHSLYFS